MKLHEVICTLHAIPLLQNCAFLKRGGKNNAFCFLSLFFLFFFVFFVLFAIVIIVILFCSVFFIVLFLSFCFYFSFFLRNT